MTPDELKSIPKGHFVVMKTGSYPMRTRLRLFLDWGITFGEPYLLPERAARAVAYAGKQELEEAIRWSCAGGVCWPGIRTIARDLRLSRATVQRALCDLERGGWIIKEPRWRENGSSSSNFYRIP